MDIQTIQIVLKICLIVLSTLAVVTATMLTIYISRELNKKIQVVLEKAITTAIMIGVAILIAMIILLKIAIQIEQ